MRVGFIGLGMQGKYMAINLAQAGYDLMVYDTRAEPLEELAAAGARIAKSNAEVGAHSEIVQVCVLDDVQVEAVVAGPQGLLETAAPGTIIVIHSTIEPASITHHSVAIDAAAGPEGSSVESGPVQPAEAVTAAAPRLTSTL